MINLFRFPILKQEDIDLCFTQLKIPNFENDFDSLSVRAFKTILRKFLEFFAGKTFQEIYNPKFSAVEYLTYPELHEESTIFLTEYRYLCEIIEKTSMENLHILDFVKIEHEKKKKVISGIINFARFKEKEISGLKSFYQIYSKHSFSSFLIISGLKFLKKKILFLQNNFGKKVLESKNIKKTEEDNFYFSHWNFVYLNNQEIQKIKSEKIEKLFEKKKFSIFALSLKKKSRFYKENKIRLFLLKKFFFYHRVVLLKTFVVNLKTFLKFLSVLELKIYSQKIHFVELSKKITIFLKNYNFLTQFHKFETVLQRNFRINKKKKVDFQNIFQKKKSYKKKGTFPKNKINSRPKKINFFSNSSEKSKIFKKIKNSLIIRNLPKNYASSYYCLLLFCIFRNFIKKTKKPSEFS